MNDKNERIEGFSYSFVGGKISVSMVEYIANLRKIEVSRMNPLAYFKIFNNEDCPCGSGIKFKECCKGKPDQQPAISKKPLEVQIMEQMRKAMVKCCMYPDKSHCKGIIKDAHALQNNKIISLLAGAERHVYTMDRKRKPLIIPIEGECPDVMVEFSRISANDATTETCFCDRHDNIAFAVIEKGAPDFDVNSEPMKFVYAYKAFIFEYYKQDVSHKIFQQCFKKRPPVFQLPQMVGLYRVSQLRLQEFEPVKKYFDSEILSGTYNGIETCVITIPERIYFANYAFIAPDYDLDGRRIKHTRKGVMHRIAITAFPEDQKSYILLSCLSNEKPIYDKFFEQLNNASIEKIKYYFSMILPLYSENMVLSPVLWNKWDDEIKTAFTFYANLNGKIFKKYSMVIGMGLRNAAKRKTPFDYSKRGKMDLFAK